MSALPVRPRCVWSLVLLALAIGGCRATLRAGDVERTAVAAEPRLSADAFFRSPTASHLALSPDGTHVAGVLERGGSEVVFALTLASRQFRTLVRLDREALHGSASIRSLGWGNDERILVSLEIPAPKAVGRPARATRLMVVDLDGSRTDYLGKNWPAQAYSRYQDDVIAWHLADQPDHILLNWYQRRPGGVSARRINVDNGAIRTETPARIGILEWHANHLGQVLAGTGATRWSTNLFLLARRSPEARFEELLRFDPFREPGFEFAAFSESPERLYVFSAGTNERRALHVYDLATRSLGPPVFAHPEVDLDGVWSSKRDGHLIAVGYTTDRRHWHFFDAAMRAEQAAIDRALPGTWNEVVDMDRDERVALVRSSSDVVSPRYYLYERARRQLLLLFTEFPQLAPEQMAPMQPIEVRARDGLALHGYLTRPREASAGPLPTIVLPHGGPTARDAWGWDPEVQFLASRGFAVLQVNYRGSTGYGSRHQRLGDKQWGLAMQDDVTDATRWAIASGIADPARIGIYGASYGGYAALMGLVKTPELFRAGASFAGVSDLYALVDASDHYEFSGFLTALRGDSGDDREQLIATSPARQAERIRAPVLIAHGTRDPSVQVRQAHQMIDALEAAGREVEFHLYQDEVHGFVDERNAIDFHTKLAAFFERHLLGAGVP